MSRAKATILCIDDYWNGLIGRKLWLEANSYEALAALSGDEGLKLFASRSIDAVLLDYQMPGMSGDLVAAKMKRLKPHVPILLLSAYGSLPASKLRFVDVFVSKSQSPVALLSALHDVLSARPRHIFHRWLDQWKCQNQVVTK
jgi:CheY-like chemotaxis protein